MKLIEIWNPRWIYLLFEAYLFRTFLFRRLYKKNKLLNHLNPILASLPSSNKWLQRTNPASNPSLTIMTRIERAGGPPRKNLDLIFDLHFSSFPVPSPLLLFRQIYQPIARIRGRSWSLIFDLLYSPSSTQWIPVAAAFRWAHRPSRALLWNKLC